MKQWLIIRYNNKDHIEHIYKIFYDEEEAVKWFDNLTLNKPVNHFKRFSYELHDCYGEIINVTL